MNEQTQFQISRSGNDAQNSPIKKAVLILIAVGIFVALVTSGLCFGPIDQIFIGWRDMTASCDLNGASCFGGGSHLNPDRDIGIAVLLFLLVMVGVVLSIKILISKVFKS